MDPPTCQEGSNIPRYGQGLESEWPSFYISIFSPYIDMISRYLKEGEPNKILMENNHKVRF